MSAIITFVIATTVFAASPDVEAAKADRARYAEADQKYIYYLTTRPHAGEVARDLERAFNLAIASDTIQPVIERSVPTKVTTGLYRIDLRDLHWRYEDFREIVANRNPYIRAAVADHFLIIRADWFLVEISDMQESDSYQRLLFGGDKIPKTQDDVLRFFKVVNDEALTWGIVEGQSEVSVTGTRLIESRPIPRGYAWITSDVLKLDSKRDPFEHLDRKFTPDGQEGIIGFPKISTTTGQRGMLQWYWLNNGQKQLVNRAPVDLVRDHTEFRGLAEIRTPGSCIQCHGQGLNQFKRNEVREFLKSHATIFANDEQRAALEAFYLGDLKTELNRANDDFQTMVVLACGGNNAMNLALPGAGQTPWLTVPAGNVVTSSDVAKSFKLAVNRYDAALTFEDTAEELGVTAEDWRKAIVANTDLPARLVSLPHGGRIPRAAWEEVFGQAYDATHSGQAFKRADIKPIVQADAKAGK